MAALLEIYKELEMRENEIEDEIDEMRAEAKGALTNESASFSLRKRAKYAPRVYLAGYEVFLPNAEQNLLLQKKLAICEKAGVIGVYPGDGHIDQNLSSKQKARAIYQSNVQIMKTCDTILANVTPFRGISADVGTVWEIGYFIGSNKVAFGYTNCSLLYEERYVKMVDDDGLIVDMQNGVDNCMITDCLYHLEVYSPAPPKDDKDDEKTVPFDWNQDRYDLMRDLTTFEKAVDAIAQYFSCHG